MQHQPSADCHQIVCVCLCLSVCIILGFVRSLEFLDIVADFLVLFLFLFLPFML